MKTTVILAGVIALATIQAVPAQTELVPAHPTANQWNRETPWRMDTPAKLPDWWGGVEKSSTPHTAVTPPTTWWRREVIAPGEPGSTEKSMWTLVQIDGKQHVVTKWMAIQMLQREIERLRVLEENGLRR